MVDYESVNEKTLIKYDLLLGGHPQFFGNLIGFYNGIKGHPVDLCSVPAPPLSLCEVESPLWYILAAVRVQWVWAFSAYFRAYSMTTTSMGFMDTDSVRTMLPSLPYILTTVS